MGRVLGLLKTTRYTKQYPTPDGVGYCFAPDFRALPHQATCKRVEQARTYSAPPYPTPKCCAKGATRQRRARAHDMKSAQAAQTPRA
jgi:hypothetical protein